MHKVQLTLTNQEAVALQGYGATLGYSLPKTIKFIIGKTAEEYLASADFPTFPMSKETEQRGLDALAEYEAGQTYPFTSVEDMFKTV